MISTPFNKNKDFRFRPNHPGSQNINRENPSMERNEVARFAFIQIERKALTLMWKTFVKHDTKRCCYTL